MTNLRLFFVGGLFSYRALFNWISPVLFATTMLGSPLFPHIEIHRPRGQFSLLNFP